jgi:hypothetical protein
MYVLIKDELVHGSKRPDTVAEPDSVPIVPDPNLAW